MQNIAQRLLEKNQALVTALETAEPKAQYKAVEPLISGALLAKIGKAEGTYIKKHTLIWAIIDCFNGEEAEDELDY